MLLIVYNANAAPWLQRRELVVEDDSSEVQSIVWDDEEWQPREREARNQRATHLLGLPNTQEFDASRRHKYDDNVTRDVSVC